MREDKFEIGAFVVIVLLVLGLVAGAAGLSVHQSFGNEQAQVCTVTEKDRAGTKDGGSDMRIYTEECGVVKVTDLFLRGQFDTADTYADLTVGKTYEFTTVGSRLPFFSEFPNILGDVKEVN